MKPFICSLFLIVLIVAGAELSAAQDDKDGEADMKAMVKNIDELQHELVKNYNKTLKVLSDITDELIDIGSVIMVSSTKAILTILTNPTDLNNVKAAFVQCIKTIVKRVIDFLKVVYDILEELSGSVIIDKARLITNTARHLINEETGAFIKFLETSKKTRAAPQYGLNNFASFLNV